MLPYSREVFVTLQGEFLTAYPWLVGLGFVLFLAVSAGVLGSPYPGKRATVLFLAALWCGAGVFWYARFWSDVDFLGPVYAALALAQAAALGAAAAIPGAKTGTGTGTGAPSGRFGAACVAAAMAYPVFDFIFGPGWPAVRLPSVFPAPLLLLTAAAAPTVSGGLRRLLLVPALLLAGAAGYRARVLGMPQDWLPPVAMLAAFFLPSAPRTGASGRSRARRRAEAPRAHPRNSSADPKK